MVMLLSLSGMLVSAGCSRFEKEKIPLYDEVFVKEPEPFDQTRRKPKENPGPVPNTTQEF